MQPLSPYSLYSQRLNALHQDICSEVERLAAQLTEPLTFEDSCDSVMYPGHSITSIDQEGTITVENNFAYEKYEYVPSEMDINDLLYVLNELENTFEQ